MTHDVFVLSDVGCVRGHNEDDAAVLPEHQVYAVADGMGGHSSGEIASQLSVRAFSSVYIDNERAKQVKKEWKREREERGSDCVPTLAEYHLRYAVTHANETIFSHAARKPALGDMGTTLVALAFSGSRVYVAFVGDSRAYRYRDGKIEQLTEDHSLLNDYKKIQKLTPEEEENFPHKNIIVRALGMKDSVEVDVVTATPQEGDILVLCSDGLNGEISDDEILSRVLEFEEDLDGGVESLIEGACENGGKDNVTVVLVKYVSD